MTSAIFEYLSQFVTKIQCLSTNMRQFYSSPPFSADVMYGSPQHHKNSGALSAPPPPPQSVPTTKVVYQDGSLDATQTTFHGGFSDLE